MAKIRVYELARDLNMKNKELLDKLEEMDISVASHMSSLDDHTVSLVKAGLKGKKDTEAVEVTRVRPTVIRRRKKKVEEEPVVPKVTPEEKVLEEKPAKKEEFLVEVSDREILFEQTKGQAPSEKPEKVPVESLKFEVPETLDEAAEPGTAEEVSMVEPAEKELPADQKPGAFLPEKADTAEVSKIAETVEVQVPESESDKTVVERTIQEKAKIIKPPEPVEEILEKTPEPEEKEKMVTPQQLHVEEESVPKEKPPELIKEKAKVEAQPEQKSELKLAEPKEKISKKPRKTKKTQAQALPEEKTVKLKTKPSKKKKAKREIPAKIIKLPRVTVEKEVEVVESGEKEMPQVVVPEEIEHPKPEISKQEHPTLKEHDREGKKKKRGLEEEQEKDKKFFKKKISFRRKEVVEGKDLYTNDKRGRKGKKAVRAKASKGHKTQITTPKAIKRRIKIDDAIMLSELAKRMGIKASDMISKLMSLGVMATVNQTIDYDTATLVAGEFGYEVERASFEEEIILKAQKEDSEKHQVTRPPVVTIMGHVDHGKTSLLDVIRKTHITEDEAGGITQHIGAYHVETEKGQIVFLDTPGHEAFTAMRARGAQVTDIVVLVVAADDGVMPQTTEAINHARASNVPIIVAVNKIDKNNAEPERVQRQLAEQGLAPEEWGGDTIFVKVSAKKNQAIDDLLEMILLQAEILELQANADKLAVGNVIEAKLDSGRGPVATILVKEGTLHAGEPVVCGIHYGKVRAMLNDRGQHVDAAGPSIPVEILGLSGVPQAGDEMVALTDERDAKQVSIHRQQKQRSVELAKTSRLSLEKLYEKMQEEEIKELNLIIKADVHGSIEALKDSLVKLSNEEVKINVVHAATGTITESDISLAAVSNAIIIGFNVRPTPKVVEYANEEHVDIRFYNVIYNAIKEVKDAIVGMMSSTYEERILGRAEVRETFHVPKIGTIAGCYVTEGKVERGQSVRLVRDGVVIFEGKISSLKRYKDDYKEVQSGYECGIGIENFNDIKIQDIIECFYLEEIKPEL